MQRKEGEVSGSDGRGGGWDQSEESEVGAPTGNVGKIIPEEGKVTWVLEPAWVQILTLLL